ncbi:MAG: hypothetical protein WC974_01670 [Thermoplasmata archaeon]
MAKKLSIDELLEKPQAKKIITYLRNIKEVEDGVSKRFGDCYVTFGKLKKGLVDTHKLPNEKALVRYLKILCDSDIIVKTGHRKGDVGYYLPTDWGMLGARSFEVLKIESAKPSQIKWAYNCTYYGLDIEDDARLYNIDWKFKEIYCKLKSLYVRAHKNEFRNLFKKFLTSKKIKLKTKCDILDYLDNKYQFGFSHILEKLDKDYYKKYYEYEGEYNELIPIVTRPENKDDFLNELNSHAKKILNNLDALIRNIVELPTVVITVKGDLDNLERNAIHKALKMSDFYKEIS